MPPRKPQGPPKTSRAPARKPPPQKPGNTSDPQHDCGPWIEAPRSTRLTRYRYDYGTGQLQVTWKNGRGHVNTTYQVGTGPGDPQGSAVYRKFAMAASKGRFVNNPLDQIAQYWPSNPSELAAPSNPNRKAVKHREKNADISWDD